MEKNRPRITGGWIERERVTESGVLWFDRFNVYVTRRDRDAELYAIAYSKADASARLASALSTYYAY